MKEIKLQDLAGLKKKDYNGVIKIIPTYLLDQLKQTTLPIKNIEIALSNICDFLVYINNLNASNGKSVFAIDAKVFERYFNHKAYPAYKELLKDLNVLTAVPYDNGTFYSKDDGLSLQYRIHNEYLQATDFTALIFKRKQKKDISILCKVDDVMASTIISEDLDYALVFEKEIAHHKENNTTLFSLYSRITRALSLTKERYIKKGTKVNRIYHSFSNLSKVTRKCFETYFYSIDLKNAQPMLLALYLKTSGIQFEQAYQDICEAGMFYEQFLHVMTSRDDIKTECYRTIFFDFKKNTEMNAALKELYPLVWQALKDLNSKGITLASILQNMEADLFNNINVTSSKKYYTLFDAIYFNNKKDKHVIEQQILKYGSDRGIKFSLSFE